MSWCTRTLAAFFLVRSIQQDPGGFRRDFRGGLPLRTHPSGGPPGRLLAISLAVARGFWGLARLRPGSALCAAADPAVAAGPPGLQPGLLRRAALDPARDADLAPGVRWTV